MKDLLLVILLLTCVSAFGIKPDREYKELPEHLGIAYTQYYLNTPDHARINVWEYKVPGSTIPTKTIILVGSDAGNMSYSIWQAKAFFEQGVRVISFDYRGFGKSSDFAINTGLLFHHEFAVDLDSVIKATREKYPHDKIGLMAMSMGTYISLIKKEPVDFYIAEGFYNNPKAVIARIKTVKEREVGLPAHTVVIKKLKPKTPSLIFCASKDMVTITAYAKAFAKINNSTIIEFEGEHLYGFNVFSEEALGDIYVKKILAFLKEKNI